MKLIQIKNSSDIDLLGKLITKKNIFGFEFISSITSFLNGSKSSSKFPTNNNLNFLHNLYKLP